MGVGISLFFIAVGAVLTFAVKVPATGIDLDVVGIVLMCVGFVVFLYTLIWWSDVMPWRRDRMVIREQHVEPHTHEPVTQERHVIEYRKRAS
jgi:hypothetical protein